MRRSIAAALLATTAACAGPHMAPQERPPDDDRAIVRSDDERAAGLEQALSALSAGDNAPDCRRACELVDQICDLSRRICLIAGRHAEDGELGARCSASEQRCRRARDRLPPDCSCQAR